MIFGRFEADQEETEKRNAREDHRDPRAFLNWAFEAVTNLRFEIMSLAIGVNQD